ncbi:MAG: hypothetical protein KC944_19370 [Candidatus Omnitrophica bacterium]|nr:hypothetical protein [Candidatus Omnitrophota bacterium]
MIKEALQFLQQQFNEANGVQKIYQDDFKEVYLLPDSKTHVRPLDPWNKSHTFDHVHDFVEFMNSDDGKGLRGRRVIFVDLNGIAADLEYETERSGNVRVPFEATRQILAILDLEQGVTQKELFQLLYSDLSETGTDELLACIRNIKLSKSEESKSSIEVDGLLAEGKQSLRVTYPTKDGQKEATIPTDWVFYLPVWHQWPGKYSIATRLEIDCSNQPILFKFHIRDLAGQQREWIQEVIKYLKDRIPGVGVYWGQCSGRRNDHVG